MAEQPLKQLRLGGDGEPAPLEEGADMHPCEPLQCVGGREGLQRHRQLGRGHGADVPGNHQGLIGPQ